MSSTVFKIKNGSTWHDYSDMVERSGLAWERNDVDGDDSGRTLDVVMNRDFLGRKRKITFKCMPDRESRYAALDDDLSQVSFEAQYRDLHGIQTREFYCTSFKATLDEDIDDDPEWSGGSFSIVEM